MPTLQIRFTQLLSNSGFITIGTTDFISAISDSSDSTYVEAADVWGSSFVVRVRNFNYFAQVTGVRLVLRMQGTDAWPSIQLSVGGSSNVFYPGVNTTSTQTYTFTITNGQLNPGTLLELYIYVDGFAYFSVHEAWVEVDYSGDVYSLSDLFSFTAGLLSSTITTMLLQSYVSMLDNLLLQDAFYQNLLYTSGTFGLITFDNLFQFVVLYFPDVFLFSDILIFSMVLLFLDVFNSLDIHSFVLSLVSFSSFVHILGIYLGIGESLELIDNFYKDLSYILRASTIFIDAFYQDLLYSSGTFGLIVFDSLFQLITLFLLDVFSFGELYGFTFVLTFHLISVTLLEIRLRIGEVLTFIDAFYQDLLYNLGTFGLITFDNLFQFVVLYFPDVLISFSDNLLTTVDLLLQSILSAQDLFAIVLALMHVLISATIIGLVYSIGESLTLTTQWLLEFLTNLESQIELRETLNWIISLSYGFSLTTTLGLTWNIHDILTYQTLFSWYLSLFIELVSISAYGFILGIVEDFLIVDMPVYNLVSGFVSIASFATSFNFVLTVLSVDVLTENLTMNLAVPEVFLIGDLIGLLSVLQSDIVIESLILPVISIAPEELLFGDKIVLEFQQVLLSFFSLYSVVGWMGAFVTEMTIVSFLAFQQEIKSNFGLADNFLLSTVFLVEMLLSSQLVIWATLFSRFYILDAVEIYKNLTLTIPTDTLIFLDNVSLLINLLTSHYLAEFITVSLSLRLSVFLVDRISLSLVKVLRFSLFVYELTSTFLKDFYKSDVPKFADTIIDFGKVTFARSKGILKEIGIIGSQEVGEFAVTFEPAFAYGETPSFAQFRVSKIKRGKIYLPKIKFAK